MSTYYVTDYVVVLLYTLQVSTVLFTFNKIHKSFHNSHGRVTRNGFSTVCWQLICAVWGYRVATRPNLSIQKWL